MVLTIWSVEVSLLISVLYQNYSRHICLYESLGSVMVDTYCSYSGVLQCWKESSVVSQDCRDLTILMNKVASVMVWNDRKTQCYHTNLLSLRPMDMR
jgi:hypothetical protein